MMEIFQLTDEQLETLCLKASDWVADNRTDWMADHRPEYMADHRPKWMAYHRTKWMMENRAEWMADHWPKMMAGEDLFIDLSVPDQILKLLGEKKDSQ